MRRIIALALTFVAPVAMAHPGHGIDTAHPLHYLSAPHAGWLVLAALLGLGVYFLVRKAR